MRKLLIGVLILLFLLPIIPYPTAYAITGTVTNDPTAFATYLANPAYDDIALDYNYRSTWINNGLDGGGVAVNHPVTIRIINGTTENVPIVNFTVVAGGAVSLTSLVQATIENVASGGTVNVNGGTLLVTNSAGAGTNDGTITVNYGGRATVDVNKNLISADGGTLTLTTNYNTVNISNGTANITNNDTDFITNGVVNVNGGVASVANNKNGRYIYVAGGRCVTTANNGNILATGGTSTTMQNNGSIRVDGGVAYVKDTGTNIGFADPLNKRGAFIEAERLLNTDPPQVGGNIIFHFPSAGTLAQNLNLTLDPGDSNITQDQNDKGATANVYLNASRLRAPNTTVFDPWIDPNLSFWVTSAGVGTTWDNQTSKNILVDLYSVSHPERYTVPGVVTTPTPSGGTTPTPTGSGGGSGTTPTGSGGGSGDGSGSGSGTGGPSISFDIVSRELELGETCKLTANISNGSGIGWSTSNPNIATVDRFGMVTAVGLGKAIITAATFDPTDSSKLYSASCEIYVTQQVKGFRMTPSSITLFVGESRRVSTSMNPPMATTNEIATYTSSNDEIATADNSGVIMGVSPGVAVITATLIDSVSPNHAFTASCVVTVRQSVPVTGITLDVNTIKMPSNSRARLTASVTPVNYSTPNSVRWSSDNPYTADVDDFGRVTAYHGGTAYITATLTDSGNFGKVHTAICQVVVTDRAMGIQVGGIDSQGLIDVGDTFTLTPTPIPSNAKGTWRWDFDRAAFDALDYNGLTLTALKAGDYLFSATFTDFLGNKMRQSWPVSVVQRLQALRIFVPSLQPLSEPTPTPSASPRPGTAAPAADAPDFDNMRIPKLRTGDALPLRAVLTPFDASEQRVNWTSSDPNLIMVSNNGLITALRPGMATIRATSLFDENIYDEVIFTVLAPEEAIAFYGLPWPILAVGGGALLLLVLLGALLIGGGRKRNAAKGAKGLPPAQNA